MTDSLGQRMKEQYEHRARYFLPRRTYTILRVDGRAFHTYTRGFQKPFDAALMEDMDATARVLCENLMGARFAYTQSDEISVLLTDFETTHSEAWFDGNLQKIVSLSASMATAAFNLARFNRVLSGLDEQTRLAEFPADFRQFEKQAQFDSRAFVIPDPVEVENYFIWRQQDATRNSISMAAQALFPHRDLHQKSMNEMQEMMFSEKGVNWSQYPEGFKNGRLVTKHTHTETARYQDKRTGATHETEAERRFWQSEGAFVFTRERSRLRQLIPPLPGGE